jgi:FtsP/CotA-like multicopper oxidase with cupredoxin domain
VRRRFSRRTALLGGLAAGGLALAASAPRLRAAAPATLDLVAAERPFPLLGPGRPPVPLWTYGEGDPLPVIRVPRGRPLLARLENRLPERTTVHWHGVRLPNAMDGVPGLTQRPVDPGESFAYEFAPPDAGTFFFHPHCNTTEQLGRGLAGVLVVEGDAEDGAYDADLVLALKDWRIDGPPADSCRSRRRQEPGAPGPSEPFAPSTARSARPSTCPRAATSACGS